MIFFFCLTSEIQIILFSKRGNANVCTCPYMFLCDFEFFEFLEWRMAI